MEKFLYPDSVAVIGVSSSLTNLARRILNNLSRFNFTGAVYAVGPRVEEVEGYPVHLSILDIEAPIDLAVLLVPAKSVPDVAQECGEKGVKRIIVESGGFREFEGEDSEAERRLLEVCREYGIRCLGPNCIGVINRENGLVTPFNSFRNRLHKGGISVISQSGGVGMSYRSDLTSEFVGISKFISYGNGLDINELELFRYLGEDESTSIISAYLEGITDGRTLLNVISKIEKPVIVLKSNTQEATHPVATSHTAAAGGDDMVLDAAFRQVGVLRVHDAAVWANVSRQLTLPLMRGKRLAILSRSGGHAVLAADAAAKLGFELPQFPQRFFEAVKQYFRKSIIRLQNPLDLGQIFMHHVITHIIEEALKLDEIDGVLFIHSYDSVVEGDLAHACIEQLMPLMRRYDKPISTVLFTQRDERQYIRELYRLPLFRTPYHAVEAMAYSREALIAKQRRRLFETEETSEKREAGLAILRPAIEEKRAPGFEETKRLLAAYGIETPKVVEVRGLEEALKAFEGFAPPVSGVFFSHSDERGYRICRTNCMFDSLESLKRFWAEIERHEKKTLVAYLFQWVGNVVDLSAGGFSDRDFGAVVFAGLGGMAALATADHAMRVAPVKEADVAEMLEETIAGSLLNAENDCDEKKWDKAAFVDCILTLSKIMNDLPEIASIGLNPLLVRPKGMGVTPIRASITLKQNPKEKS